MKKDKKILQALTISAFICSPIAAPSANAALLLYEGFDYGALSEGDSLAGANGGTGAWAGAWGTGSAGASGFAVHEYTTTGLTYSTTGGTLVTTGGAMIDNAGDFYSTRAVTDTTITGVSETFWFSYLLQEDAALFEYVKFESNTNDGTVLTGFGTDNSANGSGNEVIRAEIGNSRGSNFAFNDGDTIFVLGRITFDGSGNATLNNWYNIDLAETEGTLGSADSSVSLASGFTLGNSLSYRTGNGQLSKLDEIRLGDTFSDVVVVVVPEPSSAALLGLGSMGLLLRRRRNA